MRPIGSTIPGAALGVMTIVGFFQTPFPRATEALIRKAVRRFVIHGTGTVCLPLHALIEVCAEARRLILEKQGQKAHSPVQKHEDRALREQTKEEAKEEAKDEARLAKKEARADSLFKSHAARKRIDDTSKFIFRILMDVEEFRTIKLQSHNVFDGKTLDRNELYEMYVKSCMPGHIDTKGTFTKTLCASTGAWKPDNKTVRNKTLETITRTICFLPLEEARECFRAYVGNSSLAFVDEIELL